MVEAETVADVLRRAVDGDLNAFRTLRDIARGEWQAVAKAPGELILTANAVAAVLVALRCGARDEGTVNAWAWFVMRGSVVLQSGQVVSVDIDWDPAQEEVIGEALHRLSELGDVIDGTIGNEEIDHLIARLHPGMSGDPAGIAVRELRWLLQQASVVQVTGGPDADVFPPGPRGTVLAELTGSQLYGVVDALTVEGLGTGAVVQAHGLVTLSFFDDDQGYLAAVELLPGWLRHSGWPCDAPLTDSDALYAALAGGGVTLDWPRNMVAAAIEVIPPCPAAGAKLSGDPSHEHAQPGATAPTLCGLPARSVEMYRHTFNAGRGDCAECSRLIWQHPRRLGPREEAAARARNALSDRWGRQWPGSRPITYALRGGERWVRFHSLPQSKRYAEDDVERREILHRHRTVLDALRGMGDFVHLVVVTAVWSLGPTPPRRPPAVENASPHAWWWQSLLVDHDEDGFDSWIHLFADHSRSDPDGLDALLRLVADDETSNVIIADHGLTWLYMPYDGGADVIAPTPNDRDRLRAAHRDWLPATASGL